MTELACMPEYGRAKERMDAWWEHEIIDRAPIRFTEHNAQHKTGLGDILKNYASLKEYWYDTEYQICAFLKGLEETGTLAETFPVYYPNLGPGVYASFYGSPLSFAEVTSWTGHIVHDIEFDDFSQIKLDMQNEYWLKIEEMTDAALKAAKGRFLVGYTDLHPSMDCVADWCGAEQVCMSMLDAPERLEELLEIAYADFPQIYGHYNQKLFAAGMPSVSWMGIPTDEPMHIPSCDFATLVSSAQFERFCLPHIEREVRQAKYNVFHLDGRGVARHIDAILSLPQIQAIQLVQGVAEDEPILQWVPLIRKIQRAGRSVVVCIQPDELQSFMDAVPPEGIYLTLAAPPETQRDVIAAVEKWK